MNFQRIESTIDVEVMNQSHVTIVGGAVGIAKDLVRSGLGALTLIDYDRIDASNPSRQDFNLTDLGRLKTEATARDIRQVNPEVDIDVQNIDFCSLSHEHAEEQFAHTDLFIYATDFFPAQARGSIEARPPGASRHPARPAPCLARPGNEVRRAAPHARPRPEQLAARHST